MAHLFSNETPVNLTLAGRLFVEPKFRDGPHVVVGVVPANNKCTCGADQKERHLEPDDRTHLYACAIEQDKRNGHLQVVTVHCPAGYCEMSNAFLTPAQPTT